MLTQRGARHCVDDGFEHHNEVRLRVHTHVLHKGTEPTSKTEVSTTEQGCTDERNCAEASRTNLEKVQQIMHGDEAGEADGEPLHPVDIVGLDDHHVRLHDQRGAAHKERLESEEHQHKTHANRHERRLARSAGGGGGQMARGAT
jgi:hypothetical protein